MSMRPTYPYLKVTNLFTQQAAEVRAMVHIGATFMCVTEKIAHQLGFDVTEVSSQFVRTAGGRQLKAPKIAPIEPVFENRSHVTEAAVLDDEPLMGIIPTEAVDLAIESDQERLVVNLAHPTYPVASAK
jgi:hypothetical protein